VSCFGDLIKDKNLLFMFQTPTSGNLLLSLHDVVTIYCICGITMLVLFTLIRCKVLHGCKINDHAGCMSTML
jgi:hypothetical protein